MSDATRTPAGWYPDPSGAPGYRYWDGAHWRFDVPAAAGQADRGAAPMLGGRPDIAAVAVPVAGQPGGEDDDQEPAPHPAEADRGAVAGAGGAATDRRWWAVGVVAVAVLVLVGALVLLVRGDDEAEVVAGAPTTSLRVAPSTSAAPATTAAPTTASTTSAPATAPSTPAPGPTTALPSFGPGLLLVNQQITPGRYLSPSAPGCSWSRLKDLAGTYASYLGRSSDEGQTIVDILPTDYAFESEGCGQFVRYTPSSTPLPTFGDGTWTVNDQISAGRYQSTGAGACSWKRLANFTGEDTGYNRPGSALASGDVVGSVIVDILPTDVGFASTGCGTWARVS